MSPTIAPDDNGKRRGRLVLVTLPLDAYFLLREIAALAGRTPSEEARVAIAEHIKRRTRP